MNEAKNIDEAILRVMAQVESVSKDKQNKEQGYSYTSEEAVISAVRPAMIEQQIVVHLAKIEELHREEFTTARGSKLARTWGRFTYEFRHIPSGTVKLCESLGEGMDSGDKSVYKAQTGSRKNVLFDVFQIARRDDPEHETVPYQAAKPTPKPVFQVPAPKPPPAAEPTQSELDAGYIPKTTWRAAVVHFGKNKGRKLGELNSKQLKWYFDWEPRPYKGKISEADIKLKMALDEWNREAGGGGDEIPEPPAGEDTEIPF